MLCFAFRLPGRNLLLFFCLPLRRCSSLAAPEIYLWPACPPVRRASRRLVRGPLRPKGTLNAIQSVAGLFPRTTAAARRWPGLGQSGNRTAATAIEPQALLLLAEMDRGRLILQLSRFCKWQLETGMPTGVQPSIAPCIRPKTVLRASAVTARRQPVNLPKAAGLDSSDQHRDCHLRSLRPLDAGGCYSEHRRVHCARPEHPRLVQRLDPMPRECNCQHRPSRVVRRLLC